MTNQQFHVKIFLHSKRLWALVYRPMYGLARMQSKTMVRWRLSICAIILNPYLLRAYLDDSSNSLTDHIGLAHLSWTFIFW